MPIHLVGETINAKQAFQRAQTGELVQLLRGIYIDPSDDIDAVILSHAVRIAHYLYSSAYLSSASAAQLAPTADGRLFISGRRNQRTRLHSLEIIQNEAPLHPSTTTVIVGDDMGEMRIEASSPRQRLLEAFRLRSEHASAIDTELRLQLAERLIEEFGTPKEAADAVWALARENGWYREGEGAERFLLSRPGAAKAPANKAAFELVIAWHGEPLGRLAHDGFEWRWKAARRSSPALVRDTIPGKLPAFIESLLPEGWLAHVLNQRDERDALRRGRRYMSNITVVEARQELQNLPADILGTRLANFTDSGRFTGHYGGPARQTLTDSFEQNLSQIFARAETPRLSGVQIKAPMHLSPEGALLPAIDLPFTHILKPAGTSGFEMLPIVEWLCLELGRAAGFSVPDIALVPMPDNMPPALVVERFDIRQGPADQRRLALEDFCSILELPASAKYDGTIEQMARGMRPLSTNPAADLGILFRRALFAWLIADGDMHLKNLALLKIAAPSARTFTDVRFAPLYDAVTTRVFPGLAGDRMALKVNGKDDRFTKRDFMALARTIGVPLGAAEEAISELVGNLARALEAVRLPTFVLDSEAAVDIQDQVLSLARGRCAALDNEGG